MKKEYMKPVMESETFVANAYIAGCWKVICNGTGYWGILAKDNHSRHDTIVSGLQDEPVFDIKKLQILGGAVTSDVDAYKDSNGVLHYAVEKVDEATAEHPNHS